MYVLISKESKNIHVVTSFISVISLGGKRTGLVSKPDPNHHVLQMKTSHHKKLDLFAPGYSTQNLNYRGYIDFFLSSLGLKDPEVENETKPIGHDGNYQATPLPSRHM